MKGIEPVEVSQDEAIAGITRMMIAALTQGLTVRFEVEGNRQIIVTTFSDRMEDAYMLQKVADICPFRIEAVRCRFTIQVKESEVENNDGGLGGRIP